LIEAGLFYYPAAVVCAMLIGTGFIFSRALPWAADKTYFLSKALRSKLVEFSRVFEVYRQQKRSVGLSLLSALVATSLTSVMYYLVSRGLSVNISFWVWFAYVPVVTVISRVPITVGGLGLRDSALMFLLNSADIPASQSLSISLFFFAATVIVSVLGVGLYLAQQWVRLFKKMAIVNPVSNPSL
jgi:uncharacterized protein (TIRG00374 family)